MTIEGLEFKEEKCTVLIFFNSKEGAEKFRSKFGSEVELRTAQWLEGSYLIIKDITKSQVDLNSLRDSPHVRKVIYRVE